MPNNTQLVLENVRLSYLFAFKPNDKGKYACAILLPKSNKKLKAAVDAAIEAARLASGPKFNGKVPAKLPNTVYDGDGEKEDGSSFGPECKGMWVINSSANQQPGLVDRRCQPIVDSTQLYSGAWANVDVNFYAYNTNGNKGIACGLNNIQKVRDDEALGGRARAQDVFKPIEDDDDDDLGL